MVIEDYFPPDVETTIVNKTWGRIFDDYPVLETIDSGSLFYIKADQIRKYHEPRLVTKFDSKIDLPDIMKKNHVCILPCNERGTYVIGYFDAYTKIDMTNVRLFFICSKFFVIYFLKIFFFVDCQ